MDTKKLTKEQLVNVILEKEEEISKADLVIQKLKSEIQELKDQFKEAQVAFELRDKAVNQEFTLRKEKEKIQKELDNALLKAKEAEAIAENNHKKNEELLRGQVQLLEKKLNQLSELFETYIVSYKDQNKMFEVFYRNAKNMEAFLDQKIINYNQEEDKK